MKEQLLQKLSDNFDESLGTLAEQTSYLKEEFREFDLSNSWDSLDDLKESDSNPNNVLMYWLLDKAPLPTKLEHYWTGGDYPDIDLDFEPEGRNRIKQYLKDRFGEKNCMDVVTLGGTMIKGAIQDLARIEGVPAKEVFEATTTIKYNVNDDSENDLDYIYKTNPKVRKLLDDHPTVHDNVRKMQNIIRGTGTHASAFIIADVPVDEYIPCVRSKQKELITGYTESSSVEALNQVGLIKFDILGLENLKVNRETEEMIDENRGGFIIDWDNVDIDDPRIYKEVNNLMTAGVFQIDSSVASMVIKAIRPDCFDDLAAVNALIRPTCLQAQSHLAYRDHKDGKFDRENFPVWLDLEGKVSDFTFNILDSTYGIPIYQEQTMALLAEFCEVHLDETNKMRKIIGIPATKKTKENWAYIDEQKEIFIENATRRIGEKMAYQWWDTAVGSLTYGFNRSHCYAYSMLAFRQLFLKRYFPKEFFCALLRTESASGDTKARLMKYILEAKHFGVPVESPDVNKSMVELDYHEDKIYIGFEQVKSIGIGAAKAIRAKSPYRGFQSFLEAHSDDGRVNKKAIEALIYTDAFRFDADRVEILRQWHKYQMMNAGNHRLLADGTKADGSFMDWEPFKVPTKNDLFTKEFEYMSIVLSEENPLKAPPMYKTVTEAIGTKKDKVCKIKVVIDSITKLKAKSGNYYHKIIVNDLVNRATILVWKNNAKAVAELEKGDTVLFLIKHMDSDTFMLLKRLGEE
jgi:DNA polymerase-3 subunit alpha